jgi:hypothetical protein
LSAVAAMQLIAFDEQRIDILRQPSSLELAAAEKPACERI